MDSDPSSLVTIVLDSHAFAHQVEAIEHFVPHCLDRLVGLAEHLIHQYHVDDPAFGADDAVQEALLKLWKAVKARKIYTAELDEVLEKLVSHKLNQKVLDERAREGRRKRGGPGARHLDADFEAIESHAPPPDEQVIAEDEVEWLLGELGLQDPSLRVVAVRKADGFTHSEIAAELGRPLSVLERQVRLIKAILGRLDTDLF